MLIRRDVAAELKKKAWEIEKRKTLDKAWKPGGSTFLESLPNYRARQGQDVEKGPLK